MQQTFDISHRVNRSLGISFPHPSYDLQIKYSHDTFVYFLWPLLLAIFCSHINSKRTRIFKLLFCLHWCWSTSNLQCTGNKNVASLGLYLKAGFKDGPKHIGENNQVIFFFKYWPSCGLDFKASSLCLQCLLLKWMG